VFENSPNWKLTSSLREDRLGVESLAILLDKLDDLVSEIAKCAVVGVLEDMVLISGHFKKLSFE
jgi:hypothetical protein